MMSLYLIRANEVPRHSMVYRVPSRSAMGERTESEPRPDERPRRPACPKCGSTRTQPFTHAGPAARVNMKCTNCGHLFRGPAKS